MRVGLDSNVLIYWLGLARKPDELIKIARAQALVEGISAKQALAVPGQALGEAYNVFTRAGRTRDDAHRRLQPILRTYELLTPTHATYAAALDLAVRHKLQFWDALIIRISAENGCDLLLSEDMQDGFIVDGLTIANPFAPDPHPKLVALLDS